MNLSEEFFRLNPFLEGLRNGLARLSRRHQVAFALFNSERLFPYYVALAKALGSSCSADLRRLLDELWRNVGGPPSETEAERLVGDLQRIELGEEGCCNEWDAGVDAVGAVSLALDAWRSESPESAAKTAGNVLNRIHQRLVDETVGTTYALTADEAMALGRRIDQHPAMGSARQLLVDVVKRLRERPNLTELDIQQLKSMAQAEWSD